MKTKDIGSHTISLHASLKDVLVTLDKTYYGIVFIVDDKNVLKGIFTDGDVRRALLGGARLSSQVQEHMKKDFTFAFSGDPTEKYLKLLSDRIRHLPLIDEAGKLRDFVSWVDIMRLPIMEPVLRGNELAYVSDCITSNWISSQGNYVKSFESAFSSYHGVKNALATCNCTSALHLAMVALGIGPGDEVIVPDITFISTANAVVHAGAKPVFVDISPLHWTIDTEKITGAITKRTKAIMPVHLYGHPCDMDSIMEIAGRYGLFVIEDCAESLGARYKGNLTGTFGDVACFSFFSNKIMTTGEGGMILTNNDALFERMFIMRDHGMSKKKKYWHEVIGYNYRMTNMQAAVGLAQLEQLDDFLIRRRSLADYYSRRFDDLEGITKPPEMGWAESINWMYTVLLDESVIGISRDDLIFSLEREGLETRPFFYPLHVQPPYVNAEGDFPVSEAVSRRGISLPSGNGIKIEEIERVCSKIRDIIQHHRTINEIQNNRVAAAG